MSSLNRILGIVAFGCIGLGAGIQDAHALGYEKPILWSGRFAGAANASASRVNNSEATVLNPAGLGRFEGSEIILNNSPFLVVNKAPVLRSGDELAARRRFVPVGALTLAHQMHERVSLGLSVSVIGGAGADFGELDVGLPSQALIDSSLFDLEASLGAGVRLTPDWTVGAAWRVSYLGADLTSYAAGTQTEIEDLSGTDFSGFRVGVQYRPEGGSWGAGAFFRSSIDWIFEDGVLTTKDLATAPSVVTSTVPGVGFETRLPWLVGIGADFEVASRAKLMLQYEFADYAGNRSQVLTTPAGRQEIPLGWKNMHLVRLGAEIAPEASMPLRLGYVIGSQVIPDDRAFYGVVAPGISHTGVIGTGRQVNERLRLDAAFDVSWVQGQGVENLPNLAGDYRTLNFTFHTALAYRLP